MLHVANALPLFSAHPYADAQQQLEHACIDMDHKPMTHGAKAVRQPQHTPQTPPHRMRHSLSEGALARRVHAGCAQGARRATFWAISNPYPCGTPLILSPRVLGRQPGGLWVPRLLPRHFGAFEGVSTIKSSLKACPCNPAATSKRWKSRAPSTKPRELR